MTVFKTREKTNFLAGKLGKHYNCPLSQRSKRHLFLVAPEDHDLPRRCKGFIKCKDVDDEGNITQQTEIIVGPMKRFEGKSHLLIARQLIDMIDDVVWVRVLKPHIGTTESLQKCDNHMCGKH